MLKLLHQLVDIMFSVKHEAITIKFFSGGNKNETFF